MQAARNVRLRDGAFAFGSGASTHQGLKSEPPSTRGACGGQEGPFRREPLLLGLGDPDMCKPGCLGLAVWLPVRTPAAPSVKTGKSIPVCPEGMKAQDSVEGHASTACGRVGDRDPRSTVSQAGSADTSRDTHPSDRPCPGLMDLTHGDPMSYRRHRRSLKSERVAPWKLSTRKTSSGSSLPPFSIMKTHG